jgi:hypothetical protein
VLHNEEIRDLHNFPVVVRTVQNFCEKTFWEAHLEDRSDLKII